MPVTTGSAYAVVDVGKLDAAQPTGADEEGGTDAAG